MYKKLFQKKLSRRISYAVTLIFFLALVFFLLRGPYLSNSIKRVILPVLEDAIGERVIIDRAVINLFPFYLQTKGFKVFDEEGNKLLRVTKMRAYIDLTGLFSKEIRIGRLSVKEPELTTDRKTLERVISSIEKHTKRDDSEHFGVSMKNVRITDGKFTLTDGENQTGASGQGLYMDMIVEDMINVKFSLKDGTLKLPDLPELNAGLDGEIKLTDRKIKILETKIYSSSSSIKARGMIQLSSTGRVESGNLSGKAKISIETISEIFDLKQKKDGVLSFSGSIDLVPAQGQKNNLEGPVVKVNLQTNGWFYLETLMELLKVDDNVAGRFSFDGEIQGVYPKVFGIGMVDLENAVLDTLSLDDASGELTYENKKFSLNNFVAHTYKGELMGDAFILIPDGRYFVEANVMNINSPQFFKFIEWEPPFTEGIISGNFRLNKKPVREIELVAKANYLNNSQNRENFLEDRLSNIETDIDLRNKILTFKKAILFTSASELFLDGDINLNKKKLNLNIKMHSRDVMDLTAPYFSGLRAQLKFTGKAEGPSKNPEISGSLDVGSGTINGVPFTEMTGNLTYNPNALSVSLLRVVQGESIYEVSGSIDFRKADGLFSFIDPHYKGEAAIKNGDAKSLIAVVSKEIPVTGVVNGNIFFEGDTKKFKASSEIILEDGVAFNQPFDRAVITAVLSPENISFSSVDVYRNETRFKASGTLYFDERFNVSVSSNNINLSDIEGLNKYPFDANFSLDLKGSGTFEKPDIKFSLNILKSYFKDSLAGKGEIKGELKGKRLSVEGNFLRGIVTVDARALFSRTLPWDVNIKFKKGRYDFLLAGLLKDVPRDLTASIEGVVSMKGEKDKFSMNSRFSTLSFSLYGYNFINRKDIVLNLVEDTFRIESFSISGKNVDMNAVGIIKIGQSYNLAVDGNIDLTPLKVISKDIESIKGQGNFVIGISGSWDRPELKGEINIRNATLMLAGLPHSIGPVDGNIFFDKDKIVFDSFSAGFAGGKIIMSGAGILEKFSLKRLTVSSRLEGIKFRPLEDVSIALDGELFFETSPQKHSLLGDINIRQAKYEKRVEWKSWLVRLKEVKESPSEQPSFWRETELNVHIAGQDNIFVDNNIARTPVKIALNLQGTLAQYGLIGRIEAKEGTIFFRGNEFKILKGSVDFVEPNKVVPVFHIRAETFISGYRIKLDLDGPSDKFVLSLFSNPPLPDMDILTLLTAGQISGGTKGFESGLGAGEATAFLTGRLQDVMEERVKYITGFERFEINPQTTASGSVSPGITVGKRLLGDRLIVTYSTSVGTTDEHIIKLQYNLSNKFSIIGVRDEMGNPGADFKYRFEFK